MSLDAITKATRQLIIQHGRRISGHVLLTRGDGTGTLIADQVARLAYYHQPSPSGQYDPGMAVLHPQSNILFVNDISYETIRVDIGYEAGDQQTLYIFGETPSGTQANGGVNVMERVINQISQPSVAQVSELLVKPISTPTTEVYVNPGNYIRQSDNTRQHFVGDSSTGLSAAIAALGAGSHQIGWVCIDTVGGTLIHQFGSALAASLPLPSRYEFSDAQIMGINIGTGYTPNTPIYLYHGQSGPGIVENDILRPYDMRFAFVPGPVISLPSRVALTGQLATIAATDILTPPTEGEYSATAILTCTTTGSAGTVTVTLTWTDDNGVQNLTSSSLSLTSAGYTTLNQPIHAKTTGAIKYATTVTGATGSPAYSLYINVMRLS